MRLPRSHTAARNDGFTFNTMDKPRYDVLDNNLKL